MTETELNSIIDDIVSIPPEEELACKKFVDSEWGFMGNSSSELVNEYVESHQDSVSEICKKKSNIACNIGNERIYMGSFFAGGSKIQ